jgi:hypothetical protein
MISNDGIDWTLVEATNGNWWTSVIYEKGYFIATSSDSAYKNIMFSVDGVHWNTVTTDTGTLNLRDITYGNGRFIAIDFNGNIAYSGKIDKSFSPNNTFQGGINVKGISSFDEISFDNTTSELESNNIKDAVDELASRVLVKDNVEVASATTERMLRYRTDANNSYLEMCMKIGVATYDWIEIKKNTW